jgi:hypothetical protein
MSLYAEAAVLAVLVGLLASAGASWWGYVGAVVFAEVVGWTIRRRAILPTIGFFTHTVRALSRAEQRSTESLSQLKTVRERIRERGASESAAGASPARAGSTETIPLEPAPDRRARFDVGEGKAARPVGDLTESLGGAQKDAESAAGAPSKPGEAAAPKPGDVTSRLMNAKRRAQQELEARKKRDETK